MGVRDNYVHKRGTIASSVAKPRNGPIVMMMMATPFCPSKKEKREGEGGLSRGKPREGNSMNTLLRGEKESEGWNVLGEREGGRERTNNCFLATAEKQNANAVTSKVWGWRGG